MEGNQLRMADPGDGGPVPSSVCSVEIHNINRARNSHCFRFDLLVRVLVLKSGFLFTTSDVLLQALNIATITSFDIIADAIIECS